MFSNTFEHFKHVKCGLVYYSEEDGHGGPGDTPLPVRLVSIDVRSSVVHAAGEVVVTQTYRNHTKEVMDTFFLFPMHSDDAVTGFEVEMDGVLRKNLVVREAMPESQAAFAQALKDHPQRFWIGPDEPPDVYQTRVGLLPPKHEVTVSIAYVTEVKLSVDKLVLRIPNTVVPRFERPQKPPTADPPPAAKQPIESKDEDDDIVCIDLEEGDKAETVDVTQDATPPSPETVATVMLEVEFFLEGDSSIGLLECDSHVPQLAAIDQWGARETWTTAKIQYESNAGDFDKDFIVSITPRDPLIPRIYIEEAPEESVVMATFCPVLAVPAVADSQFIFAIDSSLDESSHEMMQRTAHFLLKSLRPKSTFNLIGAASHHKFLFSEPQSQDPTVLQKAFKSLRTEFSVLEDGPADLATPILLEEIFAQIEGSESICQVVLLLQRSFKTDEFELCESTVRRHCKEHKFRLFVIGVGEGVSKAQIGALASAGDGAFVQIAISKVDTSWQAPLTHLFTLANSPSLTDLKLSWSGWEERVEGVPAPASADADFEILEEIAGAADKRPWQQVPNLLLPVPVFSGSEFVAFGIFRHKYVPKSLEVTGTTHAAPSQSLDSTYNVQFESRDLHKTSLDIVTKLAYAKALCQLEALMSRASCPSRKARSEVVRTKEQILQIATGEGIPSKFTYFATVDLESGTEVKGHWTRQTRFTERMGGSPTSANTTWSSRIPYGSIARNKLSSMRKLVGLDAPSLPKIPRGDVGDGDGDLIDLTED